MWKPAANRQALTRRNTWRTWPRNRRSCCRAIPGRGQRAISVQCCTLFWAWRRVGNGTPLAEPHSHADDLPKYFGLLWILQDSWRHRGQRVGLQNDLFLGEGTPAANVLIAGLDKVDGTLIFG